MPKSKDEKFWEFVKAKQKDPEFRKAIKEFVKKIVSVHGDGKINMVPFPKNRAAIEIGNYLADTSKIEKMLGWKPKIKLKAGIDKTMKYYKKYRKYYWK